MNWNKIKEKYPKAFKKFKKSCWANEVDSYGKLFLVMPDGQDNIKVVPIFMIEAYFDNNKIEYKQAGKKNRFNKAFKTLEITLSLEDSVIIAAETINEFQSNFLGRTIGSYVEKIKKTPSIDLDAYGECVLNIKFKGTKIAESLVNLQQLSYDFNDVTSMTNIIHDLFEIKTIDSK